MALNVSTTMVANKPYVYLDESSTPIKLEVYVKGSQAGANYVLSWMGASGPNNTYVVSITIATSTNGTQIPKALIDMSTLNGFGSQTKIVVRVLVQGTMVGRTTVSLGANDFESNNYKLFSYLQFNQTGSVTYHGLLELGSDGLHEMSIAAGAVVTSNAPVFKMPLTTSIVNRNFYTTQTNIHFSYGLSSADNYDPSTYETLEMVVAGSSPKKTKGSTTDSEADASGDD